MGFPGIFRPYLVLLVLLALLPASPPSRDALAQEAETIKLLRLVHRNAEELLPAVQDLLGPEGMATADPPSNGLLVIDRAENVARIEAWLKEMDQPVPHLRVEVRFDNQAVESRAEVGVEGRVEAGDVAVSAGDRPAEGLTVGLEAGERQQRRTGSYVITVASGGTAHIVSGRDVPYREEWVRICRRYRTAISTLRFLQVDTGFEVRPLVTGDQVLVDITPRISYLDDARRPGMVRFTEARTQVKAPLGQWVSLVGTEDAAAEIFAAILGKGSGASAERLNIRLRISPL
jgi:hypothetical protein